MAKSSKTPKKIKPQAAEHFRSVLKKQRPLSPLYLNTRSAPGQRQPFPWPINPFFVVDPSPDDDYGHYGQCADGNPSFNFDQGKLNVHVFFSREVDVFSVDLAKNFLVKDWQGHRAPEQIPLQWFSYNGINNSHCQFVSAAPWDQILFGPYTDGWFSLELFGIDHYIRSPKLGLIYIPGIRDVSGHHLDGGYTWSLLGSNYENWFYLIG